MTDRKRKSGRSGRKLAKKLPDAGQQLQEMLIDLQEDFFPAASISAADVSAWLKSVRACSVWHDFIDSTAQLADFFEAFDEGDGDGADEPGTAAAAGEEAESLAAGDVVWVKMRSFPWWPAKISPDPTNGEVQKVPLPSG
eukprot:SAG11_NODE_875_length_6768_cov_2.183686_2_plen_140_part_00